MDPTNNNHHHQITTTHTPRHHRDDCWSESGTETLIETWGDRYLQLNRGNLRQKDWKHVADVVNSNRDDSKPPRTDVQCKNRIDTLKKKYKLEKLKSKTTPSKWPFYNRLDHLIGTVVNTNSVSRKKANTPKSASVSSVTVTIKSISKPNPNPNLSPSPNLKGVVYSGESVGRIESLGLLEEGGRESAYTELARAIVRFGEVYERIESLKQEEMMKLEKQRMEFTKEVEFQRLNMFMETQLELEKMKTTKLSVTDSLSPGKKSEL